MIAYFFAGFLTGLVVTLPLYYVARQAEQERIAQIRMRLAEYGFTWILQEVRR